MTLGQAALTFLVALVSGVIGSIVAPWVNWGIEKKRLTREDRKMAIQRWRAYIRTLYVPDAARDFRGSDVYHALLPHISQKSGAVIEAWIAEPTDQSREAVQASLNSDIAALERTWDLI